MVLGSPMPTLCPPPPQARQRCGMERQLRELRLQEERDFLQRVARGTGDARALPDTEPPLGRPHRRGTAIVPEPLASDALLPLPSSALSQRYLRRGRGGARGPGLPHRCPRVPLSPGTSA